MDKSSSDRIQEGMLRTTPGPKPALACTDVHLAQFAVNTQAAVSTSTTGKVAWPRSGVRS